MLSVHLDVLDQFASTALVRSLLGDRVDATPDVAESFARYCGHLPLAIRVAAELAAHRSTTPLVDLLEDLRSGRAA